MSEKKLTRRQMLAMGAARAGGLLLYSGLKLGQQQAHSSHGDLAIGQASFANAGAASIASPSVKKFVLPLARPSAHTPYKSDASGDYYTINNKIWGRSRYDANSRLGTTEIWRLTNKSGGWFHPIHIHLINFQILDRADSNGTTSARRSAGSAAARTRWPWARSAGPWASLAIFLLGGSLGAAAQVWAHPRSLASLVGASGGGAALMGACLLAAGPPTALRLTFVAWTTMQAAELVSRLGSVGRLERGTAVLSHLAGLALGLAAGMILARRRR